MHSVSHSGPGEPPPGQPGFVSGESRGQKRKRADSPTLKMSHVEPIRSPMRSRMRMLSKLHQRQPLADSLESLWKVVLEALEEVDPRDVQFALLYSVHAREGDDTEIPTCPGGRVTPERLALEGVIGLDQSSPDAAMFFERMPLEVCKEPHSAELRLLQMDQNSNLWRAVQTMAKSEQPVEKMMLCPIFAHDTTITGFLLLGTDSQAYNDDLRMFAHTLADSMSKSVSIVLLLKKLRDAQLTSAALLRRVEEAERSTFMFRHMAESATVGCAIFDPSGHPMWLNEAYLNLTGNSREDFRPGTWQKAILPEDLPEVEGRWNQLASGQPIVPFTFRVKQHPSATAKPGSCESLDYRWLLSNAYVDFDEDGSCRRVMGWLTDISAQKWNESLQTQRLADALETKRQTERFIDMVSHEIRNPLSAMIQTADGVLTSMDHRNDSSIPPKIRENIVDAGKTIILCAQHQKRIVDDILTLSKLDSNLLVISPNPVRPCDLVQNVVKMFEAEFWSAQIGVSISIDPSYESLSIDNVLLDESRVMQILLNLITNAIKFTRDRTERYVRIRLAASQSRPSIETSGISYIAPLVSQPVHSTTNSIPEEEVYLIFDVEDTGRGLSKGDMKSLFQRFSQASPKTYSYGGFGLGLFICRELAELQGGQIGLSSVLGRGTTFTFYVQAQRCNSGAPKPPASSNVESSDTANPPRSNSLNKGLGTTSSPPSTPTTDPPPADLDPQTLHILVVEDNKINQNVLARQLRLRGCTVHTADHGLEALAFLQKSTFNISPARDKGPPAPLVPLSVVLMDLEMPVMDGLACVRRIREMQAEGTMSRVPVIAVTANARSDQISGAMEAGMDAVVTKPFRIPELIPKIAAVVKGQGDRV